MRVTRARNTTDTVCSRQTNCAVHSRTVYLTRTNMPRRHLISENRTSCLIALAKLLFCLITRILYWNTVELLDAMLS